MEQRYAIAFMLRQMINPKEIISKLNDVYQEKALSETQIYYYIAEIRLGRPCDEKIDDFIFKQLENDPHASSRMIARKSGNELSTILSHLKEMFTSEADLAFSQIFSKKKKKKKTCFIFKFTFKTIRRCFEE